MPPGLAVIFAFREMLDAASIACGTVDGGMRDEVFVRDM